MFAVVVGQDEQPCRWKISTTAAGPVGAVFAVTVGAATAMPTTPNSHPLLGLRPLPADMATSWRQGSAHKDIRAINRFGYTPAEEVSERS